MCVPVGLCVCLFRSKGKAASAIKTKVGRNVVRSSHALILRLTVLVTWLSSVGVHVVKTA